MEEVYEYHLTQKKHKRALISYQGVVPESRNPGLLHAWYDLFDVVVN